MKKAQAKPRILFISWTARGNRPYYDPSVRYRCFNIAQELTRRGVQAEVISQQNFERLHADLGERDLYVFHRPYLNGFLADFLAANQSRCIADFDDLIFDVQYAEETPMVRVRGAPAISTRMYIAANAAAAAEFPRFTLSTAPLKSHVDRLFGGDAAIVHNAVDRGFIGLARLIRQANPCQHRPFRVGYFSGTATHDLDFRVALPGIIAMFESSPSERMLLVGPLKLPPELDVYRSRIVVKDLVPFHELSREMAKCQMVMAPLERTIFNDSKSGLKFFEAALVGCHVAATPIPDVDRFESPLLAKCTSEEEWISALSGAHSWSTDIDSAVAEVERTCSIEATVDEWLEFAGIR